MSLVNVVMVGDGAAALIASDMQGTATDHPRELLNDVSKLFPLVGQHACIGARGSLVFAMNLASVCTFRPGGFDGLVAEFVMLCEGTLAIARQSAAAQGVHGALDEAEIVLVGLSKREGKIVGYAVEKHGADNPFVMERITGEAWLAPGDPLPPYTVGPRPIDTVLSIARAQSRKIREGYPNAPGTGGPLCVATITRSRITIEKLGELSDVPAVSAARES